MRALAAFAAALLSLIVHGAAGAQSLGTFSWRLDPYCNVVRFAISADGPAFRLTGSDDACGGAPVPAAGAITANPDGTYTLAFYLITPQGQGSHTTATISPGTLGGPWRDDAGLSGALTFGAPGSGGGARPAVQLQRRVAGTCAGSQFVQSVREDGSVDCGTATGTGGGDITGVVAGTGLVGGGGAGTVTLAIAPGGVGSSHIADGSVGAADVDANAVQRRVAGVCAAGLFFTGVDAAGVPSCTAGAADVTNLVLGARILQVASTGTSNTAVGFRTLEQNLGGFRNVAVGGLALGWNTSGSANSAIGVQALGQNTDGNENTAIGWQALLATSTGSENTAVGSTALRSNFTGRYNTAVGSGALRHSSNAMDNTVVGRHAAMTADGMGNTALGSEALPDVTTGSRNIAIGWLAGGDVRSGNDNIHIGYQGAVDESNTIRVGVQQTRAFIQGIRGVTTGGANAVAVVIDSNGQLGTVSSSRRTKEDIQDMGDASAGLMRLRPVTFRYITPYADGSTPRDYGLIAEEVDEVYPDLVVRTAAGEVETVQYHKLVPMLLNELQRLRRDLDRMRARGADVDGQRR